MQVVQPVHYTHPYLLDPTHPVTINLIGCGGTGSQMLSQLARIHVSLVALGHPGFVVTVFDPDTITESNVGRQLFSVSDLGQNKAVVLVGRINRFYGLGWRAAPFKFSKTNKEQISWANITITCTDNVVSRWFVAEQGYKMARSSKGTYSAHSIPYYWLDIGNSKTTGQAVLGTFGAIPQPKKTNGTVGVLQTITDMYPNLREFEDKDTTPSCSLAEALGRQDLFINSMLAQLGGQLIWRMFRSLKAEYHGVFLNISSLTTNPIPVKPICEQIKIENTI